MKPIVTLVLVVLAAALWASFLGVGFGTGALTVAESTSPGTTVTPGYLTSSIEFQVYLSSVQQSGLPFTTSMVGSGTSTALTFGVNIWDPGWSASSGTDNCGNAGSPVFAPAPGNANSASYSISFGGGQWSGTLNGAPVTSTSSGQLTFPPDNQNGSSYAGWCIGPPFTFGKDVVSPTLQSPTTLYYPNTLVINGVFNPQVLTVSFSAQGTHCNGNGPLSGVCQTVDARDGGYAGSPNGAITGTATTTTQTQSAYSYVVVTNPGQLAYNGGTLSVQVWTGYDQVAPGQSGYNLIVDYPQARPNGGSPDSAFPQIAVPQLCAGCAESWHIPVGTSVNSSTPGWNEFIVVLQASFYFSGSATANIDLYPNAAPGEPSITMSNTGSYAGPQVGATETITATASPSAHSGDISSINFIVYYVPANGVSSAIPSCQYFVSGITCPQGNFIVGSYSGTTMTSTFSFRVSPPSGAQQVCVQAFAESTTQQASQTGMACVTIVPASCQPSASGCPVGAGFWSTVGPILFVGAIAVTLFVIALYIPLAVWVRVAVPIVVTGAVIVLIYLGIPGPWFTPGGIL
ncbi:MAG: hypothetical protein WCB19_05690 [Thermoplasmata archaeon]